MKMRSKLVVGTLIVCTSAMFVLLGATYMLFPEWRHTKKPVVWSAWQAPDPDTIPAGPSGDSIRRGKDLFHETPAYAPQYVGNKLSCSDCHLAAGTAPYASPMVGLPALFPMYTKRAGRVISLKDRIRECFTRSENGRPLPDDDQEMDALVAYIQWLSQPEPTHKPFAGRGLIDLPPLKTDVKHGAQVYTAQCAGCHGEDGDGAPPMMPAVWGANSFNDGAGMNRISEMARFVQYNMPQNRHGSLSAQDAYDVSAFIHTKPRPAFDPAYKKY